MQSRCLEAVVVGIDERGRLPGLRRPPALIAQGVSVVVPPSPGWPWRCGLPSPRRPGESMSRRRKFRVIRVGHESQNYLPLEWIHDISYPHGPSWD